MTAQPESQQSVSCRCCRCTEGGHRSQWCITAEQVRQDARVAKAKCGLGLAKGDLTRNFRDIFVERAADIVVVAKYKRLFELESDSNYVFRVF